MAASSLDDLPPWAGALVEETPLGHLAYLDDVDQPRVLPVTFAVAGGAIWTAIDQKPKQKRPDQIARVRYLRRRPSAALCLDHYEDDWSRLAWVQVLGSVTVDVAHEEHNARLALAALGRKYAAYRQEPPQGPLLRLTPERLLCWRATESG